MDKLIQLVTSPVIFPGELGKLEMLHEGILHKCIKQLLEKKKMAPKDVSEDLECLCQIMKTVGRRLDHEKAKLWMDAYFDRIRSFQSNPELQSRVRFMLQDVMELRQNRWQPRRNATDVAPKTIQQVGRCRGDRSVASLFVGFDVH